MDYLKKIKEESLFKGRIIEVVSNTMEYCQNGERGTFKAEVARRSPGVRVLIIDKVNQKILLSKEQRPELQDWDYRLPGGKVFDKLDIYLEHIDEEKSIMEFVNKAVVKETEEEAGILVKEKHFLHKSVSGASVTWDLYYFLITDFEFAKDGQKTEKGEIIYPEWKSFNEVMEMCLNGKIQEDRSVAVILKFLLNQKKYSTSD